MKRFILSVSLAVLLLSLLSGAAFAAPASGSSALKDLAAVRQATQKYHDVNQAIADGFVQMGECVEVPGVGAMGIHFANISRLMDPAISLTAPEVLLYVPTNEGLKLVGVEYMQGIGAPDTEIPNPAPPASVLFGRPFDGPMLGHEPGMPPHYDLHVWVWQANPSGMFNPLHPKLSCG